MARSSDALARATANSAAPASRSATTSRILARSTASAAFSASTSFGRSAMSPSTTIGNHTALVCDNYLLCSEADIFSSSRRERTPGLLRISPVDPLEQITHLTRRQRYHAVHRLRPHKAATVKTLGIQR